MDTLQTRFDVDLPSLRAELGLTQIEAKLLQLLMQEETATYSQLYDICARLRQLIYTIRNKLSKYGITIINDRDLGYSLPLKHKLRIKNIIDGELAEEVETTQKILEEGYRE